jgi:recombination protein RecA
MTTKDRWAVIEEIAEAVNKKFGEDLLLKGSSARMEIPHTTTGVLAFDLALGGGWASNQWNEIIGEESSGKTAIAYQTVAANQALDPEYLVMWVAAEEYVPTYAASFGVDLDRLWVVETNEMETALDLVLKAIENRAVDMVVLDSLPALVTETEVNKAMDEASVATGAQILSRFFKKCAKAQRRSLTADDRPCTMLAINQWRDKIGVLYGDPRTTPGGKAKNYYYFIRVEVRRDEWISEGTALDTRVGQTMKMRVIKNKTYRPQQIAQADFYFADSGTHHKGEFDKAKDIVNVALALELFEGRYRFEGERIAANKADLYAVVGSDPALQERLHAAAIEAGLSRPSTVVQEVHDLEDADNHNGGGGVS